MIQAWRQEGLKVTPLKPIASGAEWQNGVLINDDAKALLKAAGLKNDTPRVWNPYCFESPIAPHLAANMAGVALTVNEVIKACDPALKQSSDICLIEGAGGWLVPLNNQETMADLALAFDAEIILVVGMRLGCLNHALLTVESILNRGGKLKGWVANQIDPDFSFLPENINTLKARIPAPLLFEQHWVLNYA